MDMHLDQRAHSEHNRAGNTRVRLNGMTKRNRAELRWSNKRDIFYE